MTSKEYIEFKIRDYEKQKDIHNGAVRMMFHEDIYNYNQVLKDLDLLEVLKKLKPMIKVYQYIEPENWVLEIGELKISLDEKEKEILKEWLENE